MGKLDHDAVLLAGASGRVGGETLTALLREGAHVVLVGRSQDRLEETVRRFAPEEEAGRVRVQVADLRDPRAAESAVARTLQEFGRIDAVVNLSGKGQFVAIADSTPDDFRVNVEGYLATAYYLALPALRAMLKQDFKEGARSRGHLVTVTAGSSLDPQPEFGLFGAAKAGVNTLMKAIAREHKADGIVSNAVVLGGVATEEARGYLTPEEFAAAAHPQEVAEVLTFLASRASSGINGSLVELNAREVD